MFENQDILFVRHRGPVTCVAGIPNTRKAVTSGYDGAVGLFDLDSGEVELLGYHKHLVNRVTINSAGTLAASSSSDYTVIIWDLATHKVQRVLRGQHAVGDSLRAVDGEIAVQLDHSVAWRNGLRAVDLDLIVVLRGGARSQQQK